MSAHTFQDNSLVNKLIILLYPACVRLLQNHQHRLKYLSLFCKKQD